MQCNVHLHDHTNKEHWHRFGSSQSWLFQIWSFAILMWRPLRRSFALICTLWQCVPAFALFCVHLARFVTFCVRPHLERPLVGISDRWIMWFHSNWVAVMQPNPSCRESAKAQFAHERRGGSLHHRVGLPWFLSWLSSICLPFFLFNDVLAFWSFSPSASNVESSAKMPFLPFWGVLFHFH